MKFFFIYKSLAHPELAGDYVQPFTLAERLAHVRRAEQQLGATIPWLIDGMDNRLKHALGDRPNSEFIISPDGRIVRKRAWSHPARTRKDLEELVGPVPHLTPESAVQLRLDVPSRAPAQRGLLPLLDRTAMQAIAIRPKIDPQGPPFYAKLRAEADRELLTTGSGNLYLGFHLDPLHDAHWNNLTEPLSFRFDIPPDVRIENLTAQAPRVAVSSDADPREFLVPVTTWPRGSAIRLTVKYFACVGETSCHAVEQEYELRRQPDRDAGRARGKGAGYWEREQFASQALTRDKDGDRRLTPDEVQGLVLPHFRHFDTNQDGLLEYEELKSVADWLNFHHQPGAPARPPGRLPPED